MFRYPGHATLKSSLIIFIDKLVIGTNYFNSVHLISSGKFLFGAILTAEFTI